MVSQLSFSEQWVESTIPPLIRNRNTGEMQQSAESVSVQCGSTALGLSKVQTKFLCTDFFFYNSSFVMHEYAIHCENAVFQGLMFWCLNLIVKG